MMRLGLAITRAALVEPTWTTALVACAWLRAGHALRVIESWDFELGPEAGLSARAHCFDPGDTPTPQEFCDAIGKRTAARRLVKLADLDGLWLRTNPLNTAVLTFAAGAALAGVPAIPSPQALLLTAHKSFVAGLTDVPHPATLVTRSRAAIHGFYEGQSSGVVLKPARGSGGRGVHKIPPGRLVELDRAIDQVRTHGDAYIVAQRYMPQAEHGEKRLIWLDGRVLGAYLRERAIGEFRHNLAQGGQPRACEITDAERQTCALLTPHLLRAGVWLAGLDLIGEQVVEVNTLNPGGLHWIQALSGHDHSREVVTSLESWIRSRTAEAPTLEVEGRRRGG
jgi:glutathione synthase